MDMPEIFEVNLVNWCSSEHDLMLVRTAVFIEEQGVPAEIERDAHDADSIHALGLLDGQPVATGRLLSDGHIGRVAVLAQHRGKGFGGAIMHCLMAAAKREGMTDALLSSQVHACPFYEKLGFVQAGEVFMEAGIPHVSMKRSLVADKPET